MNAKRDGKSARNSAKPLSGFVTQEHAAELVAARTKPGPNGCVEWALYVKETGYGQFRLKGRWVKPHRLAWYALHGDTQLDLDHRCRNRRCVNPDHLEPVTVTENNRRGQSFAAVNAQKTHCIRGHELSDAKVDANGWRDCRACDVIRQRAYTERNREAVRRRERESRRLRRMQAEAETRKAA